IAYQALFDIEESDTGFSVSTKCIKFGMELIRKLLETAVENPQAIPAIEQDLTHREYFGKGTPEDGWLAWSRPAREIFNFVRAADYFPFPSPWRNPRSRIGSQEVAFIKAALTGRRCDAAPGTIGRSGSGQVWVACADEWVEVSRLTVNGQSAM